ncbi:hypothetical protein ACWGI8_10340 [Streptomyces sp. NPDC054841]
MWPAPGATNGSKGPGHWLQLDAPDRINAVLLDFIGEVRTRGAAAG